MCWTEWQSPTVRIAAALGDGPAEHRHRVDVLQQQRVRAQLLHVAADAEQHRDRPQPAHDPADAERVGDRLAQPEPLGDLEVDDGRGPVAADLERRHDVVGPVERGAPVGRRLDLRPGPVRLHEAARHELGGAQALGVDVHQRERRRVGELGEAEDVADEVAGEHRRAGADEGDPRHGHASRVCWMRERARSRRARTRPPTAMTTSTAMATYASGERRLPSDPPSAV